MCVCGPTGSMVRLAFVDQTTCDQWMLCTKCSYANKAGEEFVKLGEEAGGGGS